MKKVMIFLGILIVLMSIVAYTVREKARAQMAVAFLSTAITIVNDFERELIMMKYDSDDTLKYITLLSLDYNVSSNNIDLNNSYIAFSNDTMYITLIGNGKYHTFSYINTYKKDLTVKNIINSDKININDNVAKIKAVKYEEE